MRGILHANYMTSWIKINPTMPALCFTNKFVYYARCICHRMCTCLLLPVLPCILLPCHFISYGLDIASFPGLPHLQFLIACSMQKRRGKAWGIFSRDTRHDCHMSSRLRSTVRVIYEIDLAFCVSYEDGTSAN